MLQSEELQNEIIIVIQDEFGECEIEFNLEDRKQEAEIIVIKNNDHEDVNKEYI